MSVAAGSPFGIGLAPPRSERRHNEPAGGSERPQQPYSPGGEPRRGVYGIGFKCPWWFSNAHTTRTTNAMTAAREDGLHASQAAHRRGRRSPKTPTLMTCYAVYWPGYRPRITRSSRAGAFRARSRWTAFKSPTARVRNCSQPSRPSGGLRDHLRAFEGCRLRARQLTHAPSEADPLSGPRPLPWPTW